MKNEYRVTTAVVAFGILAYIFGTKDEPAVQKTAIAATSERAEPQLMAARPEMEKTIESPTKTSRPLASITKAEIKAIRESMPLKQQVKKEMRENPHSPSKTLMTFAKQLGPAMEKAYKNKLDAEALTTELRDCAVDNSVADAARALCVQDVEKLAENHPNLKTNATNLRAEVSPEVLKILETNDAFMKKE